MAGDVREAIVFVEEEAAHPVQPIPADLFAEMDPFTVSVGGADYSRDALYSRATWE